MRLLPIPSSSRPPLFSANDPPSIVCSSQRLQNRPHPPPRQSAAYDVPASVLGEGTVTNSGGRRYSSGLSGGRRAHSARPDVHGPSEVDLRRYRVRHNLSTDRIVLVRFIASSNYCPIVLPAFLDSHTCCLFLWDPTYVTPDTPIFPIVRLSASILFPQTKLKPWMWSCDA